MNINKAVLMGRLTFDPEYSTTQSGISVATFTVAINRRPTKDKEVKADFIRCRAWRESADFVNKYFRKGSAIVVIGKITVDNYTDKDGNKRVSTVVDAEEIQFGEAKKDTSSDPAYDASAAKAPASTIKKPSTADEPKAMFGEMEDVEDELPF